MTPLVAALPRMQAASGKMVLSIHMNTTGAAGFRKSLEGYSKAGIKYVEISGISLDGFLKTDSLPAANRLGEENQGFKYLTHQLAWERTIIGIRAAACIEAMLAETLHYVRERQVFGKTVFDFQNTKFKLAECKAQATMLRVFVDDCLGKAMRGELTAEVGAMCKLLGSEMQGRVLDEKRDLIIAAGKKYGKTCSMLVTSAEQAKQWKEAGALLLVYLSDVEVMLNGFKQAMGQIRG